MCFAVGNRVEGKVKVKLSCDSEAKVTRENRRQRRKFWNSRVFLPMRRVIEGQR